ncbi:Mu transposase domain-containing protein [Saccharothrix sp. ST-888]|uniref:Mu transposase domain-containing protein n=1 Tax=Saccharothrix sp. ST-888 TaxID=1427391 RepID=UPI0005ED42F0|nr:transposase [Saccharothrix sp. ST-888]
MFAREEYLEACALRRQGWSISAIARNLGRDRKTVRSYLSGERFVGVRGSGRVEFLWFLPYCRQRLADDAHLPATVLFNEIVELGYAGSYPTFTRALRKNQVRPLCVRCHRNPRRDGTATPHPAGEELRFNWIRLPDPPTEWGCRSHAHLLAGSLTHAGRWRGVLAENEEFPQLVEAVDRLLRQLGGSCGLWHFDRTPVVCRPANGGVTPRFADVAKYYGASVGCPPDRGDPNDSVDEACRSAIHDWWRTVGEDTRVQVAQNSLDRLAVSMDGSHPEARDTTGAATRPKGLLDLPVTPYPALVRAIRTVNAEGLVSFRGNVYAVSPSLSGAVVEVRRRLDDPYLSIATTRGAVIVRHALAPRGAGLTVTGPGHDIVLERPTHAVRADTTPCQWKAHRPPSPAALAIAAALRFVTSSSATGINRRAHPPVPPPV